MSQRGFLLGRTDKGTPSFCLGAARLAHLRRGSPHPIIYPQGLNIWIGTTRNLEKLSQRHGEVVAPPTHREVEATKTAGLGLRYHRGLGSEGNSPPCVRPVEASSFHVVRVPPKTLWRARRRGEECLLAESPRGNQAIGCREMKK